MELSVDWLENYDNYPKFVIRTAYANIPKLKDCEMEFHNGIWIHIAENGFVRYFSHSGSSRNEGGFSGAAFTFKHKGQTKTLFGPWSSRASYVNTLGFNIVDVIFDTEIGRCAGAVTLDLILSLAKDIYIVQTLGKEPIILPSMAPNYVQKPNGKIVCDAIPLFIPESQ